MKMIKIALALALAALSLVPTVAQTSSAYELVIANGRVLDPETGFDAVANIAVADGRIVSISSDPIEGAKRTIDATGLVVAPGFIDTHSHVVSLPFGQRLALRDGVTTPLELEVGAHPIDLFYDRLEGKSQTNYGASVSLAGIREDVLNPGFYPIYGVLALDGQLIHDEVPMGAAAALTKPDAAQRKRISELLEEGMRAGALGVGNPVGYMTRGVSSEEMVAVQKLAGQFGLPTFLHGRFSSQEAPTSGILSTQEMIASVGIYGGGLLVQHMHQQTLALTDFALEMVEDAQAAGLNVVAEIYPYNYGATIVGADYLVPENYGPNMGRNYGDITEVATMQPLDKARYEELMATNPNASVVFTGISDEGMLAALAHPGTTVGSDAFPLTISESGEMAIAWDTPFDAVQGHPRAAGTHARVLRLVREQDLMPLMLAVSKMSYMPAKFLADNGIAQMERKGRMQVGADADITIFDAETVQDNSTLQQAGLPSTGIPWVIVNGTVVVENSKVLPGVFPGRPIRGEDLR